MTVSPDRQAVISVTPTTLDNSQLSTSLIGLKSCLDPEDTVEPHLNLNQGDYGYSHENCLLSSTEVVARDKLGCSYILINSTNGRRCSPGDSTFLASLPSAMVMEDECPPDCVHTRYSLSMSQTVLADSVKINLRDKISSGENIQAIVTRLVISSTDFMKITTRPQPVLQFLAEVGGMMAFFLGMSFISLIECCCFGASKAKSKYQERMKMMKVDQKDQAKAADSGKAAAKRDEGVAPVAGLAPILGKQGNKTGRAMRSRVQLAEIKKSGGTK